MGDSPAAGVTGEKIWLDGEFIDWDAARVHVLTHTLHYGLGVFEGIRCYSTEDDRSAVFRLPEHVRRLFDSAHINLLDIPFETMVFGHGPPGDRASIQRQIVYYDDLTAAVLALRRAPMTTTQF